MPSELISASIVNIHAMTDLGRTRSHNEDNFIVCPDLNEKRWYLADQAGPLSAKGALLVVADGMGGANAGEVASEIAVKVIQEKFNSIEIEEEIDERQVKDYLYQTIIEAHKAILAASDNTSEYMGMGTTILIAWVFDHKAIIAWVGDSRAYLYSKRQGLKLLTKDHSLVWELVEAGKLTPEEADVHPDNNIITQSLGDKKRSPQPEFVACPLEEADRLMLCSDGLNNLLNHKAIEEILGEEIPLAAANKNLVQSANEKGGTDNITVVSLEVLQAQPRTKRKPYKAISLLLVALVLCLFGGLYFSEDPAGTFSQVWGKGPGRFLENKSVVKSVSPEGIEAASSEPEQYKNWEQRKMHHLSSDKRLVLDQFRHLDRMFSLRFPNRSINALGKYNSTLFAETAESPSGEKVEQQKRQLLNLVQKYQLGFPKEYKTEQAFLDFLAGKDTQAVQDVSTELARIEVLINQLKPD